MGCTGIGVYRRPALELSLNCVKLAGGRDENGRDRSISAHLAASEGRVVSYVSNWRDLIMAMAAVETVYIIDDDASMREALDSLFRSARLRTSAYASPREFLNSRPNQLAGCLVLDVRMPDGSGLEFQDKLSEYDISLPIIFLTGHGDVRTSVRGMKAGAVDFLTKPFHDQELLDVVEHAFKLDRQRRLFDEERLSLKARFKSLTQREHEVMTGVTAGRMNKQVAGDLGLSVVTVKLYRRSAMQKMGAKTLADLVLMSSKIKADSEPSSAASNEASRRVDNVQVSEPAA
jgi:FixJ family two-component response regulator